MSLDIATVVLQSDGGIGESIITVLFLVFILLFILIPLAGTWKTFTKADKPGWAAIIPFYNFYVMLEIGDNEWWWLLVLFVPIVNLYAAYKAHAGVARAFGQGIGFAIGLWFLPFIFFPLLGFGNYRHRGTL
mgnify:CR=1 FL=1